LGIEVAKTAKQIYHIQRVAERIPLQVPVFLRGADASGAEFIELTKTVNISATGACIATSRALKLDQVVHLTIPAPSPAISSGLPSEMPPILARVLRQDMSGDVRLSGLKFLKPIE